LPFSCDHCLAHNPVVTLFLFTKIRELVMRYIKKLQYCLVLLTLTLSTEAVQKIFLGNSFSSLPNDSIQNLIIINDCTELIPRNLPPSEINSLFNQGEGAELIEFLQALRENQFILCTKSLWISLQNAAFTWESYISLPKETLLQEFKKISFNTALQKNPFQGKKNDLKKMIDRDKQMIMKISTKFQELTQSIANASDYSGKIAVANKLCQKYREELDPTYQEMMPLFTIYTTFKLASAYNYTCKDVSDEFILFIPDNLTKSLHRLWLKFLDYDYKNFPTLEIAQNILYQAENLDYDHLLGQKLLRTLKLLPLKHQRKGEACFFNFYLTGHGSTDMTAEVSTVIKQNQAQQSISDFQKILNFLQWTGNTKSLTISSCYSGGKKFIDSFQVSNPLSNSFLEKLSYPIIFEGSFYVSTLSNVDVSDGSQLFSMRDNRLLSNEFLYAPQFTSNPQKYKEYFESLNETPPNYQNAATVLSNIVQDISGIKSLNSMFLSNFVSIKFPHTSWLTPIDITSESDSIKKKHTYVISQIYAMTHPIINIDKDVDAILLNANWIEALKLTREFDRLPAFLPMKHHNQNYVIEQIEFLDTKLNTKDEFGSSFHQLMHACFYLSDIEEQINIVVKKLKITEEECSNIYVFTNRILTSPSKLFLRKKTMMSGYMYTDPNNITKIVTWPSEEDFPETVHPQAYNPLYAQEHIARVEQAAQQDLKKIKSLSETIAAQQLRTIPEPVMRSRNRQTAEKLNDDIKTLNTMKSQGEAGPATKQQTEWQRNTAAHKIQKLFKKKHGQIAT